MITCQFCCSNCFRQFNILNYLARTIMLLFCFTNCLEIGLKLCDKPYRFRQLYIFKLLKAQLKQRMIQNFCYFSFHNAYLQCVFFIFVIGCGHSFLLPVYRSLLSKYTWARANNNQIPRCTATELGSSPPSHAPFCIMMKYNPHEAVRNPLNNN